MMSGVQTAEELKEAQHQMNQKKLIDLGAKVQGFY